MEHGFGAAENIAGDGLGRPCCKYRNGEMIMMIIIKYIYSAQIRHTSSNAPIMLY